jgi:ABC-type dipeptide/oligopeptide/nickel transport system permease subunit
LWVEALATLGIRCAGRNSGLKTFLSGYLILIVSIPSIAIIAILIVPVLIIAIASITIITISLVLTVTPRVLRLCGSARYRRDTEEQKER